ncbi:hypothetical protein BIW11_05399 [Tropilaelaps mercedesae]|uniref:Uncharacterized protein n=1 Tax=Tropilaelaps mercedesae TaxID=418985 RepID=A0A1V9Y2G7_9ACAR|nr:hypothetical protein BIW11_05399 [Tropilaelaps mercedesae]
MDYIRRLTVYHDLRRTANSSHRIRHSHLRGHDRQVERRQREAKAKPLINPERDPIAIDHRHINSSGNGESAIDDYGSSSSIDHRIRHVDHSGAIKQINVWRGEHDENNGDAALNRLENRPAQSGFVVAAPASSAVTPPAPSERGSAEDPMGHAADHGGLNHTTMLFGTPISPVGHQVRAIRPLTSTLQRRQSVRHTQACASC